MAASAIASLPFMSTRALAGVAIATSALLSRREDGEDGVRADPRTQRTARAAGGIGQADRVIAERVDDADVEGEHAVGTGPDAQLAALALVARDRERGEGDGIGSQARGWRRDAAARDVFERDGHWTRTSDQNVHPAADPGE